MGFELPQQRLFRGRHQVSNALLGHYPLERVRCWSKLEQQEAQCPSYRLTKAHPSTKLRAGSFDSAQGRLLRLSSGQALSKTAKDEASSVIYGAGKGRPAPLRRYTLPLLLFPISPTASA